MLLRASLSLCVVASATAFTSLGARTSRGIAARMATATAIASGDVVKVDWRVVQSDSQQPLPAAQQVFDEGVVRFVVNSGGYLPALHQSVLSMSSPGEKKTFTIKPEDAFGPADPNRGPVSVPADAAPQGLKVGDMVQLMTGATARVTAVTADTITIDANHELAGKSLEATVEVLEHQSPEAAGVELADFAIGCFWGAELAFLRMPGVLATKVGYTQGEREEPSYEEVCSGSTGHTECVQVVYDPKEVSFNQLLDLFWERLGDNKYKLNQVGNDRGTQYRHGVYFHTEEQRLAAEKSRASLPRVSDIATEIMPADKFWDAEDYHQQYLQKGGQSAKKNDEETIRCYG
uniref:peptidylprolyl isomerase n=1 Tax=Rhizochromulina marina TaxID=1034831 RepID=A0A7S2WGJ4_9STRA|mmetsp:Transcript_23142/g.67458  ORF Transcript_23142/g.67458 Transcript_23142/m.67458 type:complete len:347 (+) Transcript_23142:33-1073(+)